MVARGGLQNSVVVLDDGVRLPERREGAVLAPGTAPAASPHRILDVPPVGPGPASHAPAAAADLLGELLGGRS